MNFFVFITSVMVRASLKIDTSKIILSRTLKVERLLKIPSPNFTIKDNEAQKGQGFA